MKKGFPAEQQRQVPQADGTPWTKVQKHETAGQSIGGLTVKDS